MVARSRRVRRGTSPATEPPVIALPSGHGEGWSPPTPPPPAIGWNWSDRRLEREYLWHADGVGGTGANLDECAAQLLYTEAHAWNGIHDAGDDTTATVPSQCRPPPNTYGRTAFRRFGRDVPLFAGVLPAPVCGPAAPPVGAPPSGAIPL